AGAVVAVIYRDLVAGGAQLVGGGKTGRARSDDADALLQLAHRFDRLDPAFLPGRVGDVALDCADGDGAVAGLLDDAAALPQAILRADAAADFRHVRCGGRNLVGLLQPAIGGQHQPVRDVVPERAVGLAEGDAALRAARGLLPRLRLDVVGVDFEEVVAALRR